MQKDSEKSSPTYLVIDIPGLPISVNQQYEPGRKYGSLRLTLDAKVYRDMVGWEAKSAMMKAGWKTYSKGMLKAIAIYWMPANRRQDSMNDKLTWDALEKIAYKNDNQIFDHRDIKVFTQDFQRTIVILIKIDQQSHDESVENVLQNFLNVTAGKSGEIPSRASENVPEVRSDDVRGSEDQLPGGESV